MKTECCRCEIDFSFLQLTKLPTDYLVSIRNATKCHSFNKKQALKPSSQMKPLVENRKIISTLANNYLEYYVNL